MGQIHKRTIRDRNSKKVEAEGKKEVVGRRREKQQLLQQIIIFYHPFLFPHYYEYSISNTANFHSQHAHQISIPKFSIIPITTHSAATLQIAFRIPHGLLSLVAEVDTEYIVQSQK